MPPRFRRAGCGLAAAALGVALAAVPVASAQKDRDASGRRFDSLAVAIKAPVKVLTNVAVTQARLEHDVSTRILHAGVDLFTRSVRWLSQRGDSAEKTAPVGHTRYP
jgi:hypothetical protein